MIAYSLSIYVLFASVILCLGIFFFLYFCFISLYTSNPISFALIWLLGGVGCFIFSYSLFYMNKNKLAVPLWLIFLFLITVTLAAVIFGICELCILKRMSAYPQKETEYLIILGAGLKKDKITRSLKFRLDAALDYLTMHTDTIAIVSGGMGAGETITEAFAMASYLEQNGISKNRIILETQSTNTYENILYSKRFLPNPNVVTAIVTNNFHIYRAEQIAKKQLLTHVEGLAAPSDLFLLLHFMVREGFAVLKYKLTGKS